MCLGSQAGKVSKTSQSMSVVQSWGREQEQASEKAKDGTAPLVPLEETKGRGSRGGRFSLGKEEKVGSVADGCAKCKVFSIALLMTAKSPSLGRLRHVQAASRNQIAGLWAEPSFPGKR